MVKLIKLTKRKTNIHLKSLDNENNLDLKS